MAPDLLWHTLWTPLPQSKPAARIPPFPATRTFMSPVCSALHMPGLQVYFLLSAALPSSIGSTHLELFLFYCVCVGCCCSFHALSNFSDFRTFYMSCPPSPLPFQEEFLCSLSHQWWCLDILAWSSWCLLKHWSAWFLLWDLALCLFSSYVAFHALVSWY